MAGEASFREGNEIGPSSVPNPSQNRWTVARGHMNTATCKVATGMVGAAVPRRKEARERNAIGFEKEKSRT